jgi:uncharacterized protein YndB with AHSA1/START domain
MWKKVVLGLAVVVAVLVVVVALQPAEFAVERSVAIDAPAEVVFGLVQSPRAHEQWSPFYHMDPQQVNTYHGPEAGPGAVCEWEGGDAGKGRMTVTAVEPNQEVEIRLDFEEPMQATNLATFELEPADGGTHLTWRLEGRSGFVAKAFRLLVDMDEMVGGQFEKGLASLKSVAEAAADGRPPAS